MRTLLALFAALAMILPAHADEAAAWAALRGGSAVALMRHADAPGSGDPAGWRLDDCATQRNLSDKGRQDAQAVGARLKAERAVIAKVLSSPWCRCVDTARLMDVGPVERNGAFSNAFVLSERRGELADAARVVIGAWKGPGSLLVVTHGSNILELTGRHPASGEMVVVNARPDGSIAEIGRLPVPAR